MGRFSIKSNWHENAHLCGIKMIDSATVKAYKQMALKMSHIENMCDKSENENTFENINEYEYDQIYVDERWGEIYIVTVQRLSDGEIFNYLVALDLDDGYRSGIEMEWLEEIKIKLCDNLEPLNLNVDFDSTRNVIIKKVRYDMLIKYNEHHIFEATTDIGDMYYPIGHIAFNVDTMNKVAGN